MANSPNDRLQLLSRLARESASQADVTAAVQAALEMTGQLVGLQAASLFLWDADRSPRLSVSFADSDHARDRLANLENELFDKMRRERRLASAFLSFSGEPAYHTFTLPLQMGTDSFGAVIGYQEGAQSIVSENDFLSTLTALLSLTYAARGEGKAAVPDSREIDKARLSAIIETAVTVNHEVNNPLTAILGNVQLLLMKRPDLDDDLKQKLRTMEQSAMKIRDVTQRLLKLTSARSVAYNGDTNMIDLGRDEEAE